MGPVEAPALGVLFIQLAEHALPVIATALGAWLHARYGRKVQLKLGDIEVQAGTQKELEKLLAFAQKVQHENKPKRIHEP